MQRRILFLNSMQTMTLATVPGFILDSQECFNKALETVAALRPNRRQQQQKVYSGQVAVTVSSMLTHSAGDGKNSHDLP
jgi:hypothetical protein